MGHYLIEFRFHGKAKYEIKKLIFDVNRRFRLGYKRAIPHITLVGPFYANDERRLIADFYHLCAKSRLMDFTIDGFSTFESSRVVFLDVMPSKELQDFRWNLSRILKSYCKLKPFDYERNFAFHATLAMKLPRGKFSGMKRYIESMSKHKFRHSMVRVTLLKGNFILREYDFMLRRSLDRKLAKDRGVYAQTMKILKRHSAKDKSFIDKLKRIFR